MAPLDILIEQFEGERKQIAWLFPLTLGYLYTKTGVLWHLGLTMLAIGGARFSRDLGRFLRENEQYSPTEAILPENHSVRGLIHLLAFGVIWLVVMIYSPLKLYLEFDHTDPILVGLAATYGGLLVIILQILLFPGFDQ